MLTRSGKIIGSEAAIDERSHRGVRSPCGVVQGEFEGESAAPDGTVTQPADTMPIGTSPRPGVVDRSNRNSAASHADVQSAFSRRSGVERAPPSHSSAAARTERLALEADFLRRRLQREHQLAQLQDEVEQRELEAKLATLDNNSDKSRSSLTSLEHRERTESWVIRQNAATAGDRPGGAPTLDTNQGPPGPGAPTYEATEPPATAHHCPPTTNNIVAVEDRLPLTDLPLPHTVVTNDSMAQLARTITALADRPKKPDLVPFSGDVSQWLAFKSSYERSNTYFSAAENIARLHNAIRGPAYQSVASLLWTSHDPQEIVDTLQQTYARPELLVAREIADIRASPKLSNHELLNTLANKIRNFVCMIKMFNQDEYLYSPELFRSILLKLNEHTRARFMDFAADHTTAAQSKSKLESLSKFLLIEADKHLKYNFLSDVYLTSRPPAPNHKTLFKRELVHTTTSSNSIPTCAYCKKGQHLIRACQHFLSLSVNDRWQWIKDFKACYRCLKAHPHVWNNCRAAKRCGVDGCLRRHHALLHGTNNITLRRSTDVQCTNSIATTSEANEAEAPVQISNTDLPQYTDRLRGLLKVAPVVIEGPDGEFETTALLDEGSTATLIDGEVAARIGAAPARRERVRIEGVGDMSKVVDVEYVNFYIRGRNQTTRHLVEDARAIKPLSLRVPSYQVNVSDYDHLASLSSDILTTNNPPSVLIGAPDWHLCISHEVRCGRKNEPVASRTLLGWVIHGAFSNSSRPVQFVNHLNIEQHSDSLDALIKSQYDIDSLGIIKSLPRQSVDDKRAVDIVDSSARRLADGRFVVSLPWKKQLPNIIPDSYPQALSRLKALEKQMSKDPDFETAFKRFVEDILSNSYAEKCDPDTYHKSSLGHVLHDDLESSIRWYLPIFGVFHPQKKKLRAVHDAAAATKGISLNSMLLQGPDLLQSLIDILLRFREGPVALNGDIKEMFPQIKIAHKDRDAQRFLWRSGGEICEYRMTSMIFGAVCSPFIALHLKDRNAKEFETTYPEACDAILNDHYMDDYLGSHFSVADAARIASEIVTVHKHCQFEMRSWTSNIPEALSQIPKELRSDSAEVYLPCNKEVGVLGVRWNPAQDTLTFRAISKPSDEPVTKRSILSNVMKVYDPLGLLMPVTIWGRIIIQKLWREGVGWDTPLPGKYIEEYRLWLQHLDQASLVRIPRCYLLKPEWVDIQLHVIADGGEQAYACAAYWRITYVDGAVSVVLIGSKARVAPLKPLSIPRLELQAALIATRFSHTIIQAHRLKPSRTMFWTDSATVLKWIRSDARNFKPFVAHRLGEIVESSNPSNWRWLPTSVNVADDATKPKTFKLDVNHRWFCGPPFLLQVEDYWPKETADKSEFIVESDIELKSKIVGLLELEVPRSNYITPDSTRFSKWLRLLRATARVFQCARIFILKLQRPITNSTTLLSVGPMGTTSPSAEDLAFAEKMLLARSQWESFGNEIAHLRASQPLPKASRIATLAVFLDEDGLLRASTRIKLATVGSEVKAPIVLDGNNHTVKLIIRSLHVAMGHAFDESVYNELKQSYHILKARSAIKRVSSSCTGCRRYRGRPVVPPVGLLPPERMEHHARPFTNTGLDYFGPFTVTVGRRTEKRYAALYTCLVTRAIHLEVVTSLSADAALTSLRRFIARRGSPARIFSDNGTNFVGASRELGALYNRSMVEHATNKRIQWRFIPPAAPFMGGAWERLVRSVKNALQATLRERTSLKEDLFRTLLAEAEAIVNSRPLMYVPTAIDAPVAITPFHFLIGTSSVAPWTTQLTDRDLNRRPDWPKALRLADHFWARWLKEYLPSLRGSRNVAKTKELKEGDVVLIADKTLPRGLWPLARVQKTYPGPDGRVRVVDLLTKGGTLRRPVRNIITMDIQPITTEG